MVRLLLLLGFLSVAAVVQTTLADLFVIGQARPDFLLALVVYLALSFDLREVLVPIWVLGIFRDAFSLGPIGMYALIFLVVGLLVSWVRAYAFRDSLLTVVATAVFAVAVCELFAAAALSVRYPMPPVGRILRQSLLSGIYSSIVVLLLPRVLARPCRWIGLGKMNYEL